MNLDPLGLVLIGIGAAAIGVALLMQRHINGVLSKRTGSVGAPRVLLPMMLMGVVVAVAGVMLVVLAALAAT